MNLDNLVARLELVEQVVSGRAEDGGRSMAAIRALEAELAETRAKCKALCEVADMYEGQAKATRAQYDALVRDAERFGLCIQGDRMWVVEKQKVVVHPNPSFGGIASLAAENATLRIGTTGRLDDVVITRNCGCRGLQHTCMKGVDVGRER